MKIAKRVVLLVITAVSLYLVGPAILDVFSSWDQVSKLDFHAGRIGDYSIRMCG